MPVMFSELCITFFANLMPWVALMWGVSFFYFSTRLKFMTESDLAELKEEFKDKFQTEQENGEMVNNDNLKIAYAALIVSAIFILLPIRSCIKCFRGDSFQA